MTEFISMGIFIACIRRYDVGVDANDGTPVSLETVWNRIEPLHNANRVMQNGQS